MSIIDLKSKMDDEGFLKALEEIPDDVLRRMSFSAPWQYSDYDDDGRQQDSDGFPIVTGQSRKDDPSYIRDTLQKECFAKFHANPQVNTSIRGLVGRLTGLGFETSCGEFYEIQEVIEEIELDPRNRLYSFWPKYMGRFNIEGELFLSLTLHGDGFVEVDFVDPAVISSGGDGNTGIIFHPTKPSMPLFYNITKSTEQGIKIAKNSVNWKLSEQIPSIYVARYPELMSLVTNHKDYSTELQQNSRNNGTKFKKIGGFQRFIVSFDRGFVTRRAISHLRTVLEWLNHYENLKKYEIDHKKSSGSYVWVFTFEDVKALRTWLSLTDEEKRKTAIGAKLTPGGRLILPPGVSVEAKAPSLPSIKDQDTDILQMVASGLNEPEDIMTGTSKGTFASVKASRGPFSDRTSDEIAYFDRFLKYDFWSSIFFLRSAVTDFPTKFKVRKAVGFKNKEPIFKNISKRPEQLIDISYPTSDTLDIEARTRAILGVKHGPMPEQLGVSNKWAASRIGVNNYNKMRLDKATEDEKYPDLVYEGGVDAESVQEKVEGEPSKSKNQQMDELKEALSILPSSFADSVKVMLRESENKFLKGTEDHDKFMAEVFKNLTDLKNNFEDKPININVEPPIINIPKSDPPPVTVVNESVKKPRSYKITRGEDGLIERVEGEKDVLAYEIERGEDGLIKEIRERNKKDG